METIYRYPGITPFTTEQKEVFYGRENDIELLFNLVTAQKQTLLYSKSGLGKSSLINAGLIPKLTDTGGWHFSPLRFYAYQKDRSISLTANVINSIGAAELPACFLDKIIANENSLWYAFKKAQLSTFPALPESQIMKKAALQHLTFPALPESQIIKKAALLQTQPSSDKTTHLLIFDQFEEIFSYPEDDIFLFKKQLADLLYSDIPLNFRKVLEVKLRKQPDLLTPQELDLLSTPLNIKVLFAIRDDRLSLVKQLSDYLPDILRILYELKPLTREQAVRAIDLPAKSVGNFASQPFVFTPEAVNKIVAYLTDDNTQAVETTQLQILCNRCELIAIAEAKNTTQAIEITTSKIPDFENVFIDFYLDVLGYLPAGERDKAQIFIENSLIVKEQRISLDQLVCLDYVSDNSLLLLVNRHLLRTERNSTGGISYELSHDTLVSPILQVRKQRLEKEEEQRAEHERQEELRMAKVKAAREKAERERQQKQLRRTRSLLSVALIALLLAVGLGIFAYFKMKEAEQQKINAQQSEQKAKDALQNFYKAEVAKNRQSAKDMMDLLEYKIALTYLQQAQTYKIPNHELDSLIETCNRKMESE